jgi:hypothetical protein
MRSPLPAQRFRAGRSGEAYTLRRRIVAADGGTGPDPFAVLAAIYRAGR